MNFDVAIARLEEMANSLISSIPNVIVGVLTLLVFVLLAQATRLVVMHFAREQGRHRTLAIVLGRVAQWLTLFVGLFVSASVVFETVTGATLIEILGLGSIAAGFAFRDILQNFMAGILLLLNEPFKVGDQIVIGEYEGTVAEIATRATSITTYDGRRVVIPNADVYGSALTINTAYKARRLEYDLGLAHEHDIGQATALILEAVAEADEALDHPEPDVLLYKVDGEGVALRVRWWIRPTRRADALESRSQVLGVIRAKLAAHGIAIPYPTQEVLVRQ